MLENLNLGLNEIGDDGMTSLADALGNGALPQLKKLNLFNNQIEMLESSNLLSRENITNLANTTTSQLMTRRLSIQQLQNSNFLTNN